MMMLLVLLELVLLQFIPAHAIDATAVDYFTEGMELRNDKTRTTSECLPFLRAAVRLDQTNSQYLHELGLAEKDCGLYNLAKRRFGKAQLLDSSYIFHNEIIAEASAQSIYKFTVQPMISVLNGEFGDLASPFVWKDAAQEWKWNISAIHIEELSAYYGDEIMDLYPQNMLQKPTRLYHMILKNALEYLFNPDTAFVDVDASESGTYIQWNAPLSTFRDILQLANVSKVNSVESILGGLSSLHDLLGTCLAPDIDNLLEHIASKLHWNMILTAEKGAGMFFHRDDTSVSSWQMQVLGKKTWHVCPPIATALLEVDNQIINRDINIKQTAASIDSNGESDGIVDDVTVSSDAAQMQLLYEASDFHPDQLLSVNDNKANPADEHTPVVTCYKAVLLPGDLLYYPRGWWHQTLNMATPSMSVSGTLVTPSDSAAFARDLLAECGGILQHQQQKRSGEGGSHEDTQSYHCLSQAVTKRYGFTCAFCEKMANYCPNFTLRSQ